MLDDNPLPNLLKIKDIAVLFGVSRQTIHNMLCAGRCPVAPIVGTKPPKWLKADVETFLAGRAASE